MYALLIIPVVDMSLTSLHLPKPTIFSSGGYRIKDKDNRVAPFFSPIDISVCTLSIAPDEIVTDLSAWFITHPSRKGELYTTCTVLIDTTPVTHAIVEWKMYTAANKLLLKLFKKNAPFTFREG